MRIKFYLLLLMFISGYTSGYSQHINGYTTPCPGSVYNYEFHNGSTFNSKCNYVEMNAEFNGQIIKTQIFETTAGVDVPNPTIFKVTWPNQPGTGRVFAGGFGCCLSPTTGCPPKEASLNIVVGPSPSLVASNYAICPGGSTTLTATSSCGSSFYWEAPAGWIFSSSQSNIITAGSNQVTLTAPQSAAGTTATIKVRVNFPGGGSSPFRTTEITAGQPLQAYVYDTSGSNSYCPNSTYIFAVNAPPGSTFSNWQVSGNVYSYSAGYDYVSVSTNSDNYIGISIGVTVTSCGSSVLTGGNFSGNCNNYAMTTDEADIKTYPNPTATSPLTVEWPNSTNVVSIALVSPQAKILKTVFPKTNQVIFDVKDLPESNLYVIHINTGKKIIYKRVVISKGGTKVLD